VVIGSAALGCLALAAAGWARGLAALVPPLVALGGGLGALDVAMNAQASRLERQAGRSIMSSFHGVWSLGGLVGAAVAGTFAHRGHGPGPHFLVVSVGLALITALAAGRLLREPERAAGPALAWPSRAVVRIGTVAACGAIIEGGIADWSGLYLRDTLGGTAAFATAGYGAFALAMMLGRFGGDRLIDRFGRVALVRGGAALTGVALAATLCLGGRHLAVVAFVLAGLGMCTIFPIAFGAAGDLHRQTPGHAIAAVATMAYGAGLLGPPVIGFVAGATGLPAALWLLVLASASIAALARTLARNDQKSLSRGPGSP
jgi:fucose permease